MIKVAIIGIIGLALCLGALALLVTAIQNGAVLLAIMFCAFVLLISVGTIHVTAGEIARRRMAQYQSPFKYRRYDAG